MFSRLVASWLVVLVLAPFTAPFPTCDLTTLFGYGPEAVSADGGHDAHATATTVLTHATSSLRAMRVARRELRDEGPVTPSGSVSQDALVAGSSTFLNSSRVRLLLVVCASPLSRSIAPLSTAPLKLQPVHGTKDSAAAGSVIRV